MTHSVSERAHAKLNLFLDVVGRRSDGYHDLVTVFHEIDLADDLVLTADGRTGGNVTVRVVGDHAAGVPQDDSNLAARAVRAALRAADRTDDVDIEITKRTPMGGGLGGGSADAAAALRGVTRLLSLQLTERVLMTTASALGSDVAFLLRGGSAVARGRGELLESVAAKPLRFLLLVPTFPVATASVYGAFSRGTSAPCDPSATLRALASGDAVALARSARNALFPAACAVERRVGVVMLAARRVYGDRVHLTGSGSTFFVPLAPDEVPPPATGVPHIARTIVAVSAPPR